LKSGKTCLRVIDDKSFIISVLYNNLHFATPVGYFCVAIPGQPAILITSLAAGKEMAAATHRFC
jgi:hypothetical protein